MQSMSHRSYIVNFSRNLITSILNTAVVLIIIGLLVFIYAHENRPDLSIWHEVELDAEFTAQSELSTLAEYYQLEDKLFEQLEKKVYAKTAQSDTRQVNRFHKGSMSDPEQWPTNWNRSFELTTGSPRAGILLLHGMSDSPYSLRQIGEDLNRAGAHVVGLRLPGHGTAPSGIVNVQWQDMAAAVELTMQDLRKQLGNRPIFIIGYSTGGALAINYAGWCGAMTR